MWQMIQNEWRYLSRTRLLLGISLGFLVLLIATLVMGKLQLQQKQASYEAAKEHLREQWESIDAMNPHGAAHYGTYVFKPAHVLNSLDEGVGSITGNVLRVEGHVQNEMVHSEASQMQTISRFGKLTSGLLLKYVVPLLLIFLAFSSMSNEKQSGRLTLLILQGTNPLPLVLAKCLSIWLYGLGLLALVIGINGLLHVSQLSGEVVQRLGLFFLVYALYYFVITGLTTFLSARWQDATLALTTMLGIWMLWTVFLPNVLLSSVEKWHPLPSRNEFKSAMKTDRAQGLDGHNPADERSKSLEEATLAEYGVDSLSQLPINFDGLLMQADEEYGNQVWDKHFGQLREVITQQKRSLQMGGFVNPFLSLQNASMGFAASDNFHHQDFLVQVETYRRDFIKTLNDEHAFGGSATGDWGWEANNDFYRSVPDFSYEPTRLASVLPAYLMDVGLLILWAFATLALLIFGTPKRQLT
ncbi:MAG: DUF3526 domain-containing protein [Bacteroidota bacterium]